VEEVAGDGDGIRSCGDDSVDRQPEGAGDIRLSLVDAGGGLAMILPGSAR
jgi:hypothetical protein